MQRVEGEDKEDFSASASFPSKGRLQEGGGGGSSVYLKDLFLGGFGKSYFAKKNTLTAIRNFRRQFQKNPGMTCFSIHAIRFPYAPTAIVAFLFPPQSQGTLIPPSLSVTSKEKGMSRGEKEKKGPPGRRCHRQLPPKPTTGVSQINKYIIRLDNQFAVSPTPKRYRRGGDREA